MMSPEACWQAIQTRDKTSDGCFVYAVTTTGVYCRPSCASKQPKRAHVRFFPLPALAEADGFRPCKRCTPRASVYVSPQAQLTQQVCEAIHARLKDGQPLHLDALSAELGYTAQHIQRVFKAVLGITPRQYGEGLRQRHFKDSLRNADTVLDAVYAAGYGSSSRVYERAESSMGMTPSSYRKGGAGARIAFAVTDSPYGVLLAAVTERGVCAVGLYDDAASAESALRAEYPQADIIADDTQLAPTLEAVLNHIRRGDGLDALPLDIQATAFQQRVWQALREIPRGQTRTYAQVAESIGQPTATRAVAAACGSNRAAIVIPCHRVIGKDGTLTGYKWGIARKAQLLADEQDAPRD